MQTGADLYQINHSPERPFELEGIPLIGFPALRAFRDGPQVAWEPNPTASAADLLPLAENHIDTRLSDLKQWLIDLDHKVHRQKQKAYSRLQAYFFNALGRLAEGMTIGPGRIDIDKKAVYVQTADGEVPIEAVSQGTSSLMCWVGTLLARMSDVYASTTNSSKWANEPWNGPAVVLIDEIDTHMHPQWQRQLPDSLKSLFPGTQFIVTTHSPLLVASMEPESIFVLQRASGGTIELGHLMDSRDIRGLRADQILASGLFGLTSTIAPQIEKNLQKYASTMLNPEASDVERAEGLKARDELALHPLSQEETESAREAAKLIRAWMKERTEKMTKRDRQRLLREIDMELLKIRGGLQKT